MSDQTPTHIDPASITDMLTPRKPVPLARSLAALAALADAAAPSEADNLHRIASVLAAAGIENIPGPERWSKTSADRHVHDMASLFTVHNKVLKLPITPAEYLQVRFQNDDYLLERLHLLMGRGPLASASLVEILTFNQEIGAELPPL